MGLVDLDNFIESLMWMWDSYKNNPLFKNPIFNDMKLALDKQGLVYKDGKIIKTQRRISAEAKETGYGESEDERIRKLIISGMNALKKQDKETFASVPINDCINWLEKQEQKPFDYENTTIVQKDFTPKEEPKFNIGDWIVSDKTYINNDYRLCKVVGISNGCYTIQTIDGLKGYNTFKEWESDYHLWTIQDAKDGDVLVNDNEIVIFKKSTFNEKDLSGCMFVHCKLRDKNGYWYTIGGINPTNYTPTTKEQRDTLMKAMTDAGWEFDFKKKELKKIVVPIFNIGDTIRDKDFYECGSETIKDIKDGQYIFTDGSGINIDEQYGWQLVKTPTNIERNSTEWSEEDEIRLDRICKTLWKNRKGDTDEIYQQEQDVDFLKSLKQKYAWKPTKEQMDALLFVVQHYTPNVTDKLAWDSIKILELMHNDLKKL